MRVLLVGLIGLAIGCASAIPITPEETCALNNMELSGISVGNGSGTTVALNGKFAAVSNSSYFGVQCALTKEPAKLCQISAFREGLGAKLTFNEGLPARRIVNGMGYMLFVAPGILFKILSDSEAQRIQQQAIEAQQAAIRQCVQPN